jgi:cytochrome c2
MAARTPRKLAVVLLATLAVSRISQAADGDAARGEVIYQRCLACHSLEHKRVGPRHCGLFGRRAGSLKDYQYSAAMKKYGVTWNEETLDRYRESAENCAWHQDGLCRCEESRRACRPDRLSQEGDQSKSLRDRAIELSGTHRTF